MAEQAIRFDDGAAYEQYMGVWSQEAGSKFLDWLNPAMQQNWLDVGCGNGAFTQLLLERCNAKSVQGIDPSPEQIHFAQNRFARTNAHFMLGESMDLPLPDACVDYAVMALVIFFLTDPARGVAEMARVLKAGGVASAYAWDIEGSGFPWADIQNGLRTIGHTPALPPSPHAANLDALRQSWHAAGFVEVQTHKLTVERTFGSFEEYWRIGLQGPSIRSRTDKLSQDERQALKEAVRAQMGGAGEQITVSAHAHAVKGVKLG
jgi:SAM-dependent methyltransferase